MLPFDLPPNTQLVHVHAIGLNRRVPIEDWALLVEMRAKSAAIGSKSDLLVLELLAEAEDHNDQIVVMHVDDVPEEVRLDAMSFLFQKFKVRAVAVVSVHPKERASMRVRDDKDLKQDQDWTFDGAVFEPSSDLDAATSKLAEDAQFAMLASKAGMAQVAEA